MAGSIYRRFDWAEWLELTLQAPKKAGSSRRESGDDWAGSSWAGAVAMATGEGYSDVLPDADRIAAKVSETVATDLFQTTFQSSWDVAGAEVDMGRFLAGEPECMIESTPLRISRQGRAVRIVVPISVSGSIGADLIMRRGAAVMAFADVLARAQHPLEIWAGFKSTGRGGLTCTYMIQVQAANAPLDPGRIMYALAHPSMLRRLTFSAMEHENASAWSTWSVGRGYGMPSGNVQDDLADLEGNAIILPMLQRDDWSETDSVAWIERQLATIFD